MTGAKVDLASLGTVPSAATAEIANAIPPPEAVHVVGAPGEPVFENGFESFEATVPPPGFYRDRECVVHLNGATVGEVEPEEPLVVFTLPPNFRPPQLTVESIPAFVPPGFALFQAGVYVSPGGEVAVELAGAETLGVFLLDGATFRVAGC